jgi:nickel/cobalt transporter (NicO) family protein
VIGALMLRRARRSNRSEHHHGAEAECCGRAGDERQPGRQMSGRQMSGRMTVLVGLSGGLIPCPGALAALLTAGASGRLLSGLWLVLLFSVGIAATLVSVGLLARRMGAAFNRRVSSRRWERRAAVLSGALVIGVGLVSLLRVLTHLD